MKFQTFISEIIGVEKYRKIFTATKHLNNKEKMIYAINSREFKIDKMYAKNRIKTFYLVGILHIFIGVAAKLIDKLGFFQSLFEGYDFNKNIIIFLITVYTVFLFISSILFSDSKTKKEIMTINSSENDSNNK